MPQKPREKHSPAAPRPARKLVPTDTTKPDPLITLLEALANDPEAPAASRTQAARAVLEARGVLGKHQIAPGTGTAHVPLSEASRPELEAELARLRLQIAAQDRR